MPDEQNPYVVTLRFSERLMERVEREVRERREMHPGVSYTKSDVIRDVLWRGFTAEDDDE